VKYIFLFFLLVGCQTKPPNIPICFTDAPAHANCAFTISGADFQVDNVGHNFTAQGRNWTYDQLISNSLIFPPDSYSQLKQFELNYCHQNPGICVYSAAVKRLMIMETDIGYAK
jgi:hypothetical protein